MKQAGRYGRYSKYGTRALGWLAAGYFLFLMAVYPLYLGNYYFLVAHYKSTLLVVVSLIAVVGVVLILFLCFTRFRVVDYYVAGEPRRGVSVAEWAVLGFMALTLISTVLSQWGDVAWRGIVDRDEGFWIILCYVLAFLILGRFYAPRRWHMLIFAGSAILVAMIGVLQVLGFNPFSLYTEGHPMFEGHRLSIIFRTTLGNINVVSAYSSFVAVLFAALFVVSKTRWGLAFLAAAFFSFLLVQIADSDGGKVGMLAAMALLLPFWLCSRERLGRVLIVLASWLAAYAVYHGYMRAQIGAYGLGHSDAAWLAARTFWPPLPMLAGAVVLAAAGLCLLYVVKKWPQRAMRIVGIAVLPVVAVIGVVGLEVVGRGAEEGRIYEFHRAILRGQLHDDMGSGRIRIWRHGLVVLPDNPIFGTGPDTFPLALGEERVNEVLEAAAAVPDKAHNRFLQWAVTLGIPALLAYLVFLAAVFIPAAKAAFSRPLVLAFGAGALTYVVQSFFTVEVPMTPPLFWASMGVVAAELWQAKVGAPSVEL